MPLLRAQVVLKHRSGLPRDNVTNTFHFRGANATAQLMEAVSERVRSFYVEPTAAAGAFPLHRWIGPQIANANHEVRMYHVDEDTNVTEPFAGAPPVHVETFDFLGRVVPDNGEPSEVALCLSFRNVTQGTVPQARRRGRVYIGPFTNNVVAVPDASGVMRPDLDVALYFRALGERLKDDSAAAGTPWVVYSRPYEGRGQIVRPGRTTLPAIPARTGSLYDVEQLWIDNAFDTVRRRGESASVRSYGPLN